MALVATWDLRAPASPRSLCVIAPNLPSGSSHATNADPYGSASLASPPQAVAAVFGTERGSLHARSFPVAPRDPKKSVAPLGTSSSSGALSSSRTNVPRAWAPLDLSAGSLPGSVVSCLMVRGGASSGSNNNNNSPLFLLLLDDRRSTGQPGFKALVVTAAHQAFQLYSSRGLPRMACAAWSHTTGLVYGVGRTVASFDLDSTTSTTDANSNNNANASSTRRRRKTVFSTDSLPAPGVRTGQDAMALTCKGKVAVVAVGNAFYGVASTSDASRMSPAHNTSTSSSTSMETSLDHTNNETTCRILAFAQSSQVHPVLVLDLPDPNLEPDWSLLFLASGRECAVVDLLYEASAPSGNGSGGRMLPTKPRHGVCTTAAPLLAAVACGPWIVMLTSDGLVSVRSPTCLAIPLRTVEVGQRPNDFFVLKTFQAEAHKAPWIVAISYSGEGKVLECQPDSSQDLADRLMRHAIDAFGANGFPRAELAEALSASFTATSHVGPEASLHSRTLLKQYLEAVLGLADFEGGGTSGWPTEWNESNSPSTSSSTLTNASGGAMVHHGSLGGGGAFASSSAGRGSRNVVSSTSSSPTPAALSTGTALLCLVCSQVTPALPSLANRAAKACAEKMGVVFDDPEATGPALATVQVCEQVADKLLREASNFSLVRSSSPPPIARTHMQRGGAVQTDFVEAAIWLLRSCGKHERAIEVAFDRLQGGLVEGGRGLWSQIKYESYTATHLSEIWGSGKPAGCQLVLKSPANFRLLENNPRLGLSVFTASHPQNTSQWHAMLARDDPLAQPDYCYQVVKLLKSINPAVPYDRERASSATAAAPEEQDWSLPLDSGRAVTVSYLESAIGIGTGRPAEEAAFDALALDPQWEEDVANFHDELSFLLLEGVIAERSDDSKEGHDTDLGKIYRHKLRQLLKWPLAKIRPDAFMNSLPASFLQEKALVLGRLGRHEDALRILYRDLESLDLALEYCDDRHEQQQAQQEHIRIRQQQQTQNQMFADHLVGGGGDNRDNEQDNAYLPLVRVALESKDTERGTSAAIRVLAMRRSAIDRAAALRLLPAGIPVSAVARPFLIPALVDSESQVRRLTVVSALLRARYVGLKNQLTAAQLKAQANLHVVPQLKSLHLGDPLHSTKSFRARNSASASSTMPDVMIVKHFFPRHLVIQAKVTNSVSSSKPARTLTDIAFVVAESSEEAIQPLLQVPIAVLPLKMTGSTWCVLTAAPTRMDGTTAMLTCELRYTVQSPEASFQASTGLGRTFVEELHDLEVHAAQFT